MGLDLYANLQYTRRDAEVFQSLRRPMYRERSFSVRQDSSFDLFRQLAMYKKPASSCGRYLRVSPYLSSIVDEMEASGLTLR